MDFKKIKEKAKKIKDKTINIAKNTTLKVKNSKIANISFIIKTKKDFDDLIEKSKTTYYYDNEKNKKISYLNKSIVIFAIEWTNFYKKLFYIFPIISTKAFSQNITVKLSKPNIKWIDYKKYNINIKNFPCLVIFQEKKLYKIIEWEENINKLVKSINLDINKKIEEI